jgi:methyl-accepting chemotaxis protein
MSLGQAFNPRSNQTASLSVGARSSLGSKLFVYVLGSALLGLAGLSYFFYQELVNGAKREIEQSLDSKVNLVESKLLPVEQSVNSLVASTQFLQRQGAKDAASYERMVFEHFKTLDLAIAIGLGQAPNKLVTNRKWYYPYFYRDQKDVKVDQKVGNRLPFPNNNVLFSDLFIGDNYPEQGYYKQPIAAAKAVWMEPYKFYGISMTTYIKPFYDEAKQLLGVVGADVNVNSINENFSGSVIHNDGYYAILSEKGNLLSYPPDLSKAKNLSSYTSIPKINQVWLQLQQGNSGLVSSGGNFWAYRRILTNGWLMVATVPESTIITPILFGILFTSLSVATLLAIVVLIFVRQLNTRLKPILDECSKLSDSRDNGIAIKNQDEIDRLSVSFYRLINQIATNEQRVRDEVATAVQTQERMNARESEAEAEFLENEVGGLLDVVSAMEEGDLTVEAEVSDRATGLVADTLNRLREQLAEIIARVLGTTRQVVRGAEDLQKLSRVVADNTVEQAQSVAQGVSLTEEVAIAAQDSSTKASAANKSLLTAQATVEQGQVAINTLTEGISSLQKGSAQIVQKMKTLGEFVGLAEQFVQDQGQIASLTQVLAINATLVAARAAEQRDPKQFIGVAREFEAIAGQVNNLANQTNDGLAVLQQRTAQIQSVVSAIDSEVQSLGGLVEGFNLGVEQSQSAFYDIQKVTELVVNAGQSITESSVKIADAAEATVQYMSAIDKLATQTANLTRSSSLQAEQMGTLAQKLLIGIQFFRLPEALMATLDDTGVKLSTPIKMQTIDIEMDNFEDQLKDV